MDELIEGLKKDIIAALRLETVQPGDIDAAAPLFGEGLGLDSIDALELIVMMEKKYGLKIDSAETGKKVFSSVNAMAAYIRENGKHA